MATLEEYRYNWPSEFEKLITEREDVIAYLRSEATKGTSDFEHKMNKIIAAIERGDHEG